MNEGAGRGIILVAVAVLIGAILLGKGFDDTVSTARSDSESASSSGAGNGSDDDDGEDPEASVGSPLSPSEINVIVANGSGVPDAAAAVSATLTGIGYAPLPPTNTVVETTLTPLDSVYYATNPNTQAQAEQVAADLGLAASTVLPIPAAEEAPAPMGLAQVLVVLGSAEGSLAYSAAGAGTTTPPTVP